MWNFRASEPSKKLIVAVFVLSFLVGSASGAVFGVVGASLLLGYGNDLSSFVPAMHRLTTKAPVVAEPGTVPDVVRRVAPAVVSIVITKDVPNVSPSFGDDFFNDFFGFSVPRPQPSSGTRKQEIGGGTGFFVSADGLVVTNKHVVADAAADYTVLTNDGKRYDARVLARDSVTDLALVKISGSGFPTIPLGDSSTLVLGQPVIAIGNALGEFRNTVSTGVISGLARSITARGSSLGVEQLSGVIQTDAAINPGNSGGPLLNLAGEVIGINTAVATGAENIGFALPISEVKQAIESVQKSGRIVRPFLGVRYVVITADLAKEKQLSVEYGALLVRGDTQTDVAVTPGSPADKAGLQENDIILEVNGKKITDEQPLTNLVAGFKVGDTITLKVLHRGSQKDVQVTLTERK